MKISKKIEDFKVYVEDDGGNFIITSPVMEAETSLDRIITCKVSLKSLKEYFFIKLTREQIKSLSRLLSEVTTHL
jgi:hypothetical protein